MKTIIVDVMTDDPNSNYIIMNKPFFMHIHKSQDEFNSLTREEKNNLVDEFLATPSSRLILEKISSDSELKFSYVLEKISKTLYEAVNSIMMRYYYFRCITRSIRFNKWMCDAEYISSGEVYDDKATEELSSATESSIKSRSSDNNVSYKPVNSFYPMCSM